MGIRAVLSLSLSIQRTLLKHLDRRLDASTDRKPFDGKPLEIAERSGRPAMPTDLLARLHQAPCRLRFVVKRTTIFRIILEEARSNCVKIVLSLIYLDRFIN